MVRREVKEIRIMRLVERFADFLHVGYLGYHRVDARSNDLRGSVGVKPAATWRPSRGAERRDQRRARAKEGRSGPFFPGAAFCVRSLGSMTLIS
jgi:hypothetical protein